jgi:hypothetical protein
MFLKQSTTSQEILLGPFLDDTDGKTAETGLTIANTDIKLWKSGGTTESNKNSGGATHIASGRYYAVLDATDTDTVGLLEVSVSVSGALPVRRQFYVLEEAIYDALFGASAAGYQVPIWSSAAATVNLSGTTIKTATDVETDTQDIQSRLPAALQSGRMDSYVSVMATDVITNTALATSAVTEIQTGLATSSQLNTIESKIDAVDDFVDTEVSAIKTVTDKLDTAMELDGLVYRFTANALEEAPSGGAGTADWTSDERTAIRAILGIPGSGTTPADPTSGILDTIRDKVDAIDDYVDTEVAAIKTVVDAIEVDTQDIQSRLPAALVSGRMDSSVGAMEPNTITSSVIATGAITASSIQTNAITDDKIAASAITEIQSGLATTTQLTTVEGKIDAIDGVTDKLDTTLELDGAVYRFTTNALEQAPSGGGGGSTVIVSPLSAQSPERVVGTTITTYVGDLSPVSVDVYDADDDPVDLSAQGNLEVCIESRDNVDLQVIAHASITISGASSNKATWTPNSSAVAIVDKHRWSLRTASGKKVLAYGPWIVARAALNDA